MARSKLCAAAGAGTLAAFLLVGGAAIPVASAGPGFSHDAHGSQRGGDSRSNDHGSRFRGGQGRDDGGWQRGGDPIGPKRTTKPGGVEPADGTGRTAELKPNGSGATQRTATTSRSEVVTSPSVKVPNSTVTVRPASGGGGTVAAPPIVAPPVTFGNGRSPGILSGRLEDVPRPTGGTPAVAAPEPAPAVTPQLPPSYRLDGASAERIVAPLWADAVPGWPSGLPFGIAGLILAPIAGAWLGYRQARAGRAAAQLIRH
ncbi:hypothetical protein CIW52_21005 [Mycolicibacterium sp. P9-64]|uniref:hypothetical protein n=1 Tax=Mycolicibacterium sp. P9-64 TaxID=2024612 RepID=UPI0011EF2C07|nr:hypothetical protein [Mycolicibacterium sp. P9-64]KAA0081124.1 hypothetical protein CIW52_21005 [Mycolicibacterium sp. P9-64]